VYYSEVPPPIGYVVADLPEEAGTVALNNTTYHYYQNAYYVEKDGKYEVVESPSAKTADAAAPDPKALAQLQRMADFLATVRAGRVTIRDTSDEILDSGQKVQVESTRAVAVRAPTRLAVDFTADGATRRTVYDGKTITIYEKAQNLYSQQDMPPTLSETLDVLASKYGMAVPAVELLRPGLMDKLKPQLRSASYLGMQAVDGAACHAVSLSLDWADVQIWIQDGQKALPRRAVISYKKIPSVPKYVMSFSDWDLATPPDSAFEMKLPADASKVEMASLEAKE
jgi:hypothetical protein